MKTRKGINTSLEEMGNGFSAGFSFNLKSKGHCELKDIE